MSKYKVVHGKYSDIFTDLKRAQQKRDNKWAGNAEIYIEVNGVWELLEDN